MRRGRLRLTGSGAASAGMIVWFRPVRDIEIATQSSRSQYQYTLTGTDSAEVILWSERLVAELRRDPMFRDVSSENQSGGLRASLDINRQRAGQLGVNLQGINDTLNDAFAQRQISTIYGQPTPHRPVLPPPPSPPPHPPAPSNPHL